MIIFSLVKILRLLNTMQEHFETFSLGMDDAELAIEVKKLHERYNDLVKFVPQTDDKAFNLARVKDSTRHS